MKVAEAIYKRVGEHYKNEHLGPDANWYSISQKQGGYLTLPSRSKNSRTGKHKSYYMDQKSRDKTYASLWMLYGTGYYYVYWR